MVLEMNAIFVAKLLFHSPHAAPTDPAHARYAWPQHVFDQPPWSTWWHVFGTCTLANVETALH